MSPIRHPLSILMIILAGCSQLKKKDQLDAIIEAGEAQKKLYRQLSGKWKGAYYYFNAQADTTFYSDYTERLDYQLTGKVSDSSLIRDISYKKIPATFSPQSLRRDSETTKAKNDETSMMPTWHLSLSQKRTPLTASDHSKVPF